MTAPTPDEIRTLHASQEKQALLIAFTRLSRYASPNEAVDFVEAMLASVAGPAIGAWTRSLGRMPSSGSPPSRH